MSETKIALEGLLTHPGWLLFRQMCRAQWGAEGYGRQVKRAIATAREKHTDVAHAVEAVDFANDQINSLLSWPSEEVRRLVESDARELAPITQSRRGPHL